MLLAILLCGLSVAEPARAFDLSDDLTISGYADLRAVAPPGQASWLKGGLGKFRYGGDDGTLQFGEGVLQLDADLGERLAGIVVLRAEPRTPGVVDALEGYLRYTPTGGSDLSWSVKAGAFFPTISLENDDLGWASPYTLTPSAINSWIGDELRTLGSEATLRWRTAFGTVSVIGAALCCNDEAGILMADRGWSMDDRPMGLLERVRLPVTTQLLFSRPAYARTGMFDEIDGRLGWYAGVNWQMPALGKISVLRYDNDANPADRTSRDTAWDTRFWSFGGRSQFGSLVLIGQGLIGQTVIKPRPTIVGNTKFQSAFLLASYDFEDWRLSAREDLFQTRRVAASPSPLSEDGHAFTASLSWSGFDGLRLTAEVITLQSRRGEYLRAGLPSVERADTQFQFDTRFFF
ncbi:MAG TPA: hypothetical protein VG798_06020 [Rhizomicrobium sp.]|nr:hypothetical protein [Rhizomicrobium sp.]